MCEMREIIAGCDYDSEPDKPPCFGRYCSATDCTWRSECQEADK